MARWLASTTSVRFEEQSAENWQHAARGDFAGLFRHCQLAVAAMQRQGGGLIINIASIYGVVRPSLRFLLALRQRTVDRGFPPDDELRQHVEGAADAVHKLSVTLHYLSVNGGVWRSR
jgi:NAD(P)-dependent dehydrogenase (short-subunit alcohol dehydrogenase family)